MKSLQAAIQNRDLSALQGMMGADKPISVRNEAVVDLFNELFRQLRAAFPAAVATIKTQDDLNTLRQQWTFAFKENGIRTIKQIEAGMIVARRQESPFLPSPGQFISWCRQGAMEVAGFPSVQELVDVVKRYCRNQDLYPSIEDYPWGGNAIYWMGKSLYFDMRENHWTDAQLRDAAKHELLNMSIRIEAGEVIPAPITTIASTTKIHRPLSGDRGMEKIKEIRASLAYWRAKC